jgi:very-short-patch-repair endonuclease
MAGTDWGALDERAREVLRLHRGVAHVAAFDAAGITRRQVAALRGRGVLERPRIGWYVDPALPWQAKRAVRVGGVADCITAAALWGLPVPPDSHRVLHVHVAEHEGPLRHNRDRTWVLRSVEDDGEVKVHRGVRREPTVEARSGLVDTLLVLAGCVPLDWFVAALDAARHVPRGGRPLLDDDDYKRLIAQMPSRLSSVVDLVDAGAESCLETLLRLGMLRRGIAPVALQAQVHPRHRVDFLVGDRLVVEADGEAFHDAEADRIRDAELVAQGYFVLRFSYLRIVTELDAVLDEIEQALAAL